MKTAQEYLDKSLIQGRFQLSPGKVTEGIVDLNYLDRYFWRRNKIQRALGDLILEKFDDCETIIWVAGDTDRLALPVASYLSAKKGIDIGQVPIRRHKDGSFAPEPIKRRRHIRKGPAVIVGGVYNRGEHALQIADTYARLGQPVLGAAVLVNINAEGERLMSTGPGQWALVEALATRRIRSHQLEGEAELQ